MRHIILSTTCLIGVWAAAPALAATTHPLFGITLSRQTHVDNKPKPRHPWTLLPATAKTPFDTLQDNLQKVENLRQQLRALVKKNHDTGKRDSGGAIGQVGGIGPIGGDVIQTAGTDRHLDIEAAEALAEADAWAKKRKTLSDILAPRSNKLLALEVRLLNRKDTAAGPGETGGLGLVGIGASPAPQPAPAAAQTESNKPTPAPSPAPQKGMSPETGAIGKVGGIGKTGPNRPENGQ